jgi:phage terminase large subunit-like protein
VQASVTAGGAVKRREAALVGVAERYGGERVERAEVEGVRVSRGSGSSSRVAPASRRRRRYGSAVTALLLAPPLPLLPPLLRLRVGEQGIGFPRAARVGEF